MRLWFAIALLSIGCAHSRGAFDPGQPRVCGGGACYRVGPLPNWRLMKRDGAQLGFFDDAHGAVIASNATCRDDADATPLGTLTGHLLIGYTERRVRSQSSQMLNGREALRSIVDAKLDGVPIVLDLFVLKRNGCIFDLSLASPPAGYAGVERDFARFVSGFSQERS